MEILGLGEPLPKMTCKSTKCEDDLHCFRKKRAKPETLVGTGCHACQKEMVDWKLAYTRDISKVDQLFSQMRHELIRDRFWKKPLKIPYLKKLFSKGKASLREDVAKRIKNSVSLAGRKQFRDGMQTPTETQNIIYFAQHATATCCRICIKYWHGVPYEDDLTAEQETYFQELIMKYIEERLPNLPEHEEQIKVNISQLKLPI